MKSKSTGPGKDLRAIQRAFAAGIMRPLTPGHRMKPKWVDGKSTREAVAKFIKPNDRLSSFDRLEIYNKQYWYRLLDCLYEDFPGLRTVIGDERFHAMSVAYLTKYPSNSYALRDLGDRLEKFLVKEPRWTASHPRLARDIVRLEWAHIVAFDGEALPPLEVDALLDGGDPAKLHLGFQPHITFLACDYPVDNFILAVRRREEPQGEASNAVSERSPRKRAKKLKLPKPGKMFLAVHRSENSVWYKRLEPEAYLICTALQKGITLQKACERAFRSKKQDNNFSATLRNWFEQWAAFGWFCSAK
ncbi:MAG: DNA-binding domain-containing protein [Methylacidiphilales bacterium]|nr:DNA-binding domain-containing protein [Candidatus Methylacidiphilales bacterium]